MTSSHATPSTGSHETGTHHAHPNYMAIFFILCLLTVASVIADMAGGAIGKLLVGLIVLVVASLKAMYVMMYFMHLKFEGAWKWVLLAPTVILALAVPAALAPDIAFKYYDPQNPQQKAFREQQALEKAAHAEAHPAAATPAAEAPPAEKH